MIRCEGIGKAFGLKVLLHDVSYHFPAGERVALVGPNGAGKTTFLNILCKLDDPDHGQVLYPNQVSVGYLPQIPNPNPCPTVLEECEAGAGALFRMKTELDKLTETLDQSEDQHLIKRHSELEHNFRLAGGYSLTARAGEVLHGLGFDESKWNMNPINLSGGWRMRLELARIFLADHSFLILDEPTNHLDLPSLAWVERYLQQFKGTLLFVSHDRALLNRLSTLTLHLHNGRLTPYVGNFDKFIEQKAAQDEERNARKSALGRQREHMESFVERFGAKASKAKQAQSRVKMIERLRSLEQDLGDDDAQEAIALQFKAGEKSGRTVLTTHDLAIGYGSTTLSSHINLEIEHGMRIAIIGANGIGKSTLLKTLIRSIPSLHGAINLGFNVFPAYFAQDQLDILQDNDTVLNAVLKASATVGEREARQILGAFLFRGDDVFKRVGVLSGGEKSRVGLARILATEANFLILDEPTNHLDMSSVEMLAEALEAYPGTALFVSHDRSFIDAVATHVFAMLPTGQHMLFEGDLADYERLAAVAGFPNVLQVNQLTTKHGDSPKSVAQVIPNSNEETIKQLKRDKAKAEKRVSELEKSQHALQSRIDTLSKELEIVDTNNYQKLSSISAALEQAKADLLLCEDEWLQVSEVAQNLLEQLIQLGRQ